MTDRNPPNSEDELIRLISSIDAAAPPELHRRVQEMADAAAGNRSSAARHPLAFRFGTGATALAAVALALVLVLGGSSTSSVGVEEAAASALAGATLPAPAENPADRAQLASSVEGIAFPYWRERFGWRSSGSRIDMRDGRMIKTVFYTDRAGRQVGYAIVAGTPTPSVGGGSVRYLHGTPYHLVSVDGTTAVSWVRDGHLCVVSGRGVPPGTLLALASWHEHPNIS